VRHHNRMTLIAGEEVAPEMRLVYLPAAATATGSEAGIRILPAVCESEFYRKRLTGAPWPVVVDWPLSVSCKAMHWEEGHWGSVAGLDRPMRENGQSRLQMMYKQRRERQHRLLLIHI